MKAIYFFVCVALSVACTSQTDNNNNNIDTIKADSMPVLKPAITDSANIVPPPTNDSNVVKPPQ